MNKDSLDIYFDDNYGKLYEQSDNGIATIYNFQGSNGKVKHQFIKREIPQKILPDGEQWYDIVTPYGYGGPLIIEIEDDNKEQLVKEFYEEFAKYCENEHIVSEFVRFHPVVENALDFKEIYNPTWDRYTVGTNLKDFDNPIQMEFSKSCRKHIRHAYNKGVEYKIIMAPDNLEEFQKAYFSTMKRNDATDYYYFDEEYFQKILYYYRNQIVLGEALYEGKVIAASLNYISNKIIHVHLSGTFEEYLNLSPAYILKHGLAVWGKENGYEYIHYGGGRSNKEDDELFLFKKKFGANTCFDFYVGRKIWQPQVYDKICEINHVNINSSFFPAYRSR